MQRKGVKINTVDQESFGEVIGVFAGDGYTYFEPNNYHYFTRFFFNVKEKEYVGDFAKVLSKFFNKNPFIHPNKNRNIFFASGNCDGSLHHAIAIAYQKSK